MSDFNNPQYKYIESELLVSKVKNMLSSYFQQGIIDESLLYPVIKSCLDRLGHKVFPQYSTLIPIVDKMGELPKDFYKMIYAIGVGTYEQWENPADSMAGLLPRLVEKSVVSIPACKSTYDFCTDEQGNMFEFVQEFDIYKYQYKDVFNVAIKNSEKYCTGETNAANLGLNATNEIAIRNNCVFANFSGYLYIEYLSSLIGKDEEIIVPDYTQITDWIEAEMIVECFKKIYYNGQSDVYQRLQDARQSAYDRKTVALHFNKMLEVQDLYDLRKILKSRFKKYTNAVTGNFTSRYPVNYYTTNLT